MRSCLGGNVIPRPHWRKQIQFLCSDFTNSTGEPVFDGTLRQGLEVQLEQSPFLSLVSQDRIQQTLRTINWGSRRMRVCLRQSLAKYVSEPAVRPL